MSFFIYPVLGQDVVTRVVLDGYVMTVLVAMLFAVGRYRHLAVATLVVGVVNYASDVAGYFYDVPALGGARIVLDLLFLGIALGVMLASVLRNERVTAGKIYGAIAVYLLIGLTWAFLFDLLEFVQPGSFHLPGLNPTSRLRAYPPPLRPDQFDLLQLRHTDHARLWRRHAGDDPGPHAGLAGGRDRPDVPGGAGRPAGQPADHPFRRPGRRRGRGRPGAAADPPEAAGPRAPAPDLAAVQAEWRELLAAQQRQIASSRSR